MKTFVVVPTYNEVKNLPVLIGLLHEEALDIHVLGVDDASPDGTGVIADQLATTSGGRVSVLHRERKLGLASAYFDGYREALRLGADLIVQMDSDLSHPPDCIDALLTPLWNDIADVVIGSRYVQGGGVERRWPMRRKLLSRGGNLYARVSTGMPFLDVTSGFRCFTRLALEQAMKSNLRCKGFGFQIEVAYLCWKRGLRIQEVPFQFVSRDKGRSKITIWVVLEALLRIPQARLFGFEGASTIK